MRAPDALRVWLLGTVVAAALAGSGWAQPYRDDLPLGPEKLLQNMAAFASRGDFTKLPQVVLLAKPLLAALSQKASTDLEAPLRSAIANRDKAAAQAAVARVLFHDVSDLIAISLELMAADPVQAQAKYKAAHASYLLLAPEIQSRDFATDQRVRANFRNAILSFGGVTPYQGDKAVAAKLDPKLNAIQQHSDQIRADLAAALK